ncbi:MAG: hypothetical protein R2783_00850 [Gelidibacter sp.]
MKHIYAGTAPSVMFILLMAIFATNGVATFLGNAIVPNITKVISIIVILTFYFTRINRMATVFLTIFVLLLFGDVLSVFNFGDLASKLSVSFYLGSYFLFIFVLLGKLKRIKYEGLVSIYLLVVLVLNTYFLYMLYGTLKANFTDNVNLVLYICHGITLLAMAFFAFAVYLSKETTQSIVFLMMVCCFVFSDVLGYICNLYVYYWMFDFIGNMLHLASLCLFYVYVSNHHKIIKVKDKVEHQSYEFKNPERLTA